MNGKEPKYTRRFMKLNFLRGGGVLMTNFIPMGGSSCEYGWLVRPLINEEGGIGNRFHLGGRCINDCFFFFFTVRAKDSFKHFRQEYQLKRPCMHLKKKHKRKF